MYISSPLFYELLMFRKKIGMDIGCKMLDDFFIIADDIIILLPWSALINSERRTKKYIEKGLKKIIHLPRKAFPGSKVQTCVLVFRKGYHAILFLRTQK
jgi:hypothetical protein